MHSSMPPNTLSFLLFLLLLVRNAHSAGVSFTSPGGSATLPPGPLTVTWVDAGGDPAMGDLVAYTLDLIVGGNTAADGKTVQRIGQPYGSVASGQVEGYIAANASASVENGFYLRMTSNATDGTRQVINYSHRFTLIRMEGYTEQIYLDGANAAQGNSDVPSSQVNSIEKVSPISSSSSSSSATTATATQSSSPQRDDQHDDGEGSGDGLSTPITVGLVVGGLLALVGAISIIVWTRVFWRKRRQRQQKEAEKSARRRTAALMEFDKAELPAESHPSLRSRPSELSPDTERFEAGGWERAIEMQATDAVFELDGNNHVYEAGSGRRSKATEPSLYEAGSGRRSQAYDPTS